MVEWSFTLVASYLDKYLAVPYRTYGDYKVLRLHETSSPRWYGRRSQWCEVATIMDGGAEPSWRRRPWGPLDQTSFFCEYKASVNGVLYFVPHIDFASLGRIGIAALDLESEEWKPETHPVQRFRKTGYRPVTRPAKTRVMVTTRSGLEPI